MSDTPPRLPNLPAPKFQTARTVTALVLREMGSTYGRSPGGYLWALLEPIGMIVVLSIGFSLLMRSPSLGTSFLLFYASGYLPYSLYADIQMKVSKSLKYSQSLLAYPRVTWVDAVVSRVVLNVLTNLTVASILITGILYFTQTRAVLDVLALLNGMAMATALGVGVGLMNCLLEGLFELWRNLWKIISRPLFLASAIIYIYEDLPEVAQSILWWNPLVHVTGLTRTGIFPTYDATYASAAYVYGVALILTATALLFLRTSYRTILER